MAKVEGMVNINVPIPEELYRQLKIESAATGKMLKTIVADSLREHLQNEDIQAQIIAEFMTSKEENNG